jgi:hypothetical protein
MPINIRIENPRFEHLFDHLLERGVFLLAPAGAFSSLMTIGLLRCGYIGRVRPRAAAHRALLNNLAGNSLSARALRFTMKSGDQAERNLANSDAAVCHPKNLPS